MESSNGEGTINPKTNKLAELKEKVSKKLAELGDTLVEKVVDLLLKVAEKLGNGEPEKAVMEGMGLGDYCLTR